MLTYHQLLVTQFLTPPPDLDVLVGLDIILQCELYVSGPGRWFRLTF
jgi:hypothetical protein